MRRGVDQPIYNAARETLARAAEDKKLSRARAGEIERLAFGKAQLDGNASHLRRVMQQVSKDPAARPNVEAVLDKVEDNQAAARRETKAFDSHLAQHKLLTPAQIRTRKKLLRQIDPAAQPAVNAAAGGGGAFRGCRFIRTRRGPCDPAFSRALA